MPPFDRHPGRSGMFIDERPRARADGVYPVSSSSPTPGRGIAGISSMEGASFARRLSTWTPNRQHINSILASEGPLLRARIRQLVANTPHGANASDTFVTYATGNGIVPSSLVREDEIRASIKQAWTDWTDEADADGLTDLYGEQSLAARALFDAGECFIRFRSRFASDGLTVPLQLQVIEAEQLDQSYTILSASGNPIRQGIEFDAIGRRIAYWFWRTHPGDGTLIFKGDRVRVPADQVLHMYKPLRPGQIRGRPWLTAGMVKLYDYDQYDDAEMLRKKYAAMFMAFVTHKAGADISDTGLVNEDTIADSQGTAEVDMEPGLAQVLPEGFDIKFTEPADVGPNYEAFQFRNLLALCASMGLPYHDVTGDTSKANYSSLRASLVALRRRIEQFQNETLIFQMCRPIYRRWLPIAILSGAVEGITDFNQRANYYLRAKWITPRWEWVDPLKDLQAEKLAVDSGFKARSDVIESMGEDPEETDARIAADHDREARLGLSFPVGFTKAADPPAGVDTAPTGSDQTPPPAPAAADEQATEIHLHMPGKGVEVTRVTKHDAEGRILEYERREVAAE